MGLFDVFKKKNEVKQEQLQTPTIDNGTELYTRHAIAELEKNDKDSKANHTTNGCVREQTKIDSFEAFKNEYFNGDEEQALRQLAYEGYSMDLQYTKTKNNIQKILNELSKEKAHLYLDYFIEEKNKNPKRFKETLYVARTLATLDMEYNQVVETKLNPYKKKFWKSALFFCGVLGLSALIISLVRYYIPENIRSEISAIVAAFVVPAFVGSLFGTIIDFVRIFKFRSLKKKINEFEEEKAARKLKESYIEMDTEC